jgi:cytochrome c-type biogenesis protein CcmH
MGAFLIFAILALAALGFIAWPVMRGTDNRGAKIALLGSLSAFVLAIGIGGYFYLGRPDLAERSFVPTDERDYAGLIATLAHDVRKNPKDVRGWLFLGAGYMKLRDPDNAAKAFARAIQTGGPRPPAGLYALYGEALTEAAQGEVSDEARAAFERTIALDPHNISARYYLGLLHAQKREDDQALAIWRSLLADAPKDAPWRQEVVDRIAMLSARNGTAPNIEAMVASLDAKLKANPNDAQGWQMLIRAYTVLGRNDKAKAALGDARTVLAKDSDAMNALSAEAKALKLE